MMQELVHSFYIPHNNLILKASISRLNTEINNSGTF